MTVEQILTEIYKSDCADEVFLALSKRVISEKAELNKQIAKAPTVEERPQGEWIEHYSKEMSEKGYFLCSRCKCGFKRFEKGVRHSDLPWIDGQKYELHCIDNYCPNCGASMQKGGAE